MQLHLQNFRAKGVSAWAKAPTKGSDNKSVSTMIRHPHEIKALLLGDDTRAFLTIMRSLGRKKITVDACPLDFKSPALKSKYIRCVHRLPLYNADPNCWVEACTALIYEKKYDLIIPCDDRFIIPLMHHRGALGDIPIAIIDRTCFDLFFDKAKTREIAQQLGIPIASGRWLESTDTADILIENFGLPLAIKPKRSFTLDNLAIRQSVRLVDNRESLARVLESISTPGEYLVEKFFAGSGIGVSVLANEGRILQIFEHHRLREPITGGGSSYRVSAQIDSELETAVTNIIGHAGLTGLSMCEFRKDFATGSWILIEVNARPWGSIALPVSLGIDFPYLLFELLTEKKEVSRRTYPVGHFARHTTADLYNLSKIFRLNWRVSRLNALSSLAADLASYMRVFMFREIHDTFAWDDLAPAVAEYWQFIGASCSSLGRQILCVRRWRRRRSRALVLKKWAHIGVNDSTTIIFLCQGNICRSPFARELMEQKARGLRLLLECKSAGMLPFPGRESPGTAVEAARSFGVNLKPHRSSVVDEWQFEDDPVVVVFDQSNLNALRKRFPRLSCPVVLLSDLLDGANAPVEIEDPYGKSIHCFFNAYEWIEMGVEQLLALIVKSKSNLRC